MMLITRICCVMIVMHDCNAVVMQHQKSHFWYSNELITQERNAMITAIATPISPTITITKEWVIICPSCGPPSRVAILQWNSAGKMIARGMHPIAPIIDTKLSTEEYPAKLTPMHTPTNPHLIPFFFHLCSDLPNNSEPHGRLQ